MTDQPTDPTAVRDFVMACAFEWANDRTHRHSYGGPSQNPDCPQCARLQQAVEWAMARARVEGIMESPIFLERAEADAAEKWSKLDAG